MNKKFYITFLSLCLTAPALGNERIHKRFYTLNIPANAYTEVKPSAVTGAQLPIAAYPELGQYAAFRIIPAKGDKAGTPIDIVIQTEPVNRDLLKELKDDAVQEQGISRKQAIQTLLASIEKLKSQNQGVHAIYRAIATPKGIRYKLLNVAVPGILATGAFDKEAVIVATPIGNLQIFENTDKPGEKSVMELDTTPKSK